MTPGTYNNLTVDSLGRVTNGTNVSYLTAETDAVIGNEITDVSGTGLVRTLPVRQVIRTKSDW